MTRPSAEDHDVVVVGGGPAGALTALLLARRGYDVVVIERTPAYRWRACGVFSSPATVAALRAHELGDVLEAAVLRIPAMRVESAAGTWFRLTYGDDGSLRNAAVGFDRASLDDGLLDAARSAGATIRRGATASGVEAGGVTIRDAGGRSHLAGTVIVGADGLRSVVARAHGVLRPARFPARVGLTFHIADPRPAAPRDARIVAFRDGYVGLAPVPGDRLNVGIVLGASWRSALRQRGPDAVAREILAAVPRTPEDAVDWASATRCDAIEGAAPLAHRVARVAGADWLLVGDAAGFLDPFTGEGLHRAVVSAGMAARAIDARLAGRSRDLDAYDRALRARFRSKDVVSLLVQACLSSPLAFEYLAHRLAARPAVRETMGLVMGDLVPASRALAPAFVASLFRP